MSSSFTYAVIDSDMQPPSLIPSLKTKPRHKQTRVAASFEPWGYAVMRHWNINIPTKSFPVFPFLSLLEYKSLTHSGHERKVSVVVIQYEALQCSSVVVPDRLILSKERWEK